MRLVWPKLNYVLEVIQKLLNRSKTGQNLDWTETKNEALLSKKLSKVDKVGLELYHA